jgi:hypothetical protein
VQRAGQPSTDFVWTSTGNRIVGAENNETSEGSGVDKPENSFFGENSKILEMNRLETVPVDHARGADYESDYSV